MRLARVFFDVHMGKNFKGLLKICHKSGLKPEALSETHILFLNGKQNKFKVLVDSKYLVYFDNKGRAIPMDAIRFLPSAFKGNRFDFDEAVLNSLKSKGSKRGSKKRSLVQEMSI